LIPKSCEFFKRHLRRQAECFMGVVEWNNRVSSMFFARYHFFAAHKLRYPELWLIAPKWTTNYTLVQPFIRFQIAIMSSGDSCTRDGVIFSSLDFKRFLKPSAVQAEIENLQFLPFQIPLCHFPLA